MILTEKRYYAKVIRARVYIYRARVLDTASRNASSRVSRSNILETRSKRARKKCIVSAGRYCSCILQTIQKIKQEKAIGMLVIPNWPTQLWYPLIALLLLHPPLVCLPSKRLLHLPAVPKDLHPLAKD